MNTLNDEPVPSTKDIRGTTIGRGAIFLLWALSTILGLVLGTIWGLLAAALVFQLGQQYQGVISIAIVVVTGFIVGGLSSGLIQSALLRRQGFHDLPWIRTCGLGWGIVGLVLPLYTVFAGARMPDTVMQLSLLLCGAILGGLIQWTVLRKHVRKALWWVGAASLGWMSVWSILASPQMLPSTSAATIALVLLLPGAITGLAAAWLFHPSNRL